MQRYVTPSQMKRLEERADACGVSYYDMMKNAGASAACEIKSAAERGEISLSGGALILCGNGNNGGDGFVIASELCGSGITADVALLCGEPRTETARLAFSDMCGVRVMRDREKLLSSLGEYGVIVDAVFGTGFHGELPGDVAEVFAAVSRLQKRVIAIDVPSGVNSVNGAASPGTMECFLTVTFAFKKLGADIEPARSLCGRVTVADIGIPTSCEDGIIFTEELCRERISSLLPRRRADSHKGDYGRLINIAGSGRMPGAAALSTMAALRSGVGLCTLITAEPAARSLSSSIYEAMYLPLATDSDGFIAASETAKAIEYTERADSVCIGPGLGVTDGTKKLVREVLSAARSKIILDADGINCIGGDIDIIRNANADVILTPHPGELSRLLGVPVERVVSDRLSAAVELYERCGAVVVAKGSSSLIVGEGLRALNKTGNPGLARGGSGDVLTGIIGAFAAEGLSAADAALCGVYIHGYAADIAAEKLSAMGMLPSDVISNLPLAFGEL